MPRGEPVNWTRERLEQVEAISGREAITALAQELGIGGNTIYSIKSRIKTEGVDEILRKQAHRYETYRRGGGRLRESLQSQLARVHNITVGNAGRGGATAQYTITIPSRLGEAWVAKWGQQIRFEPCAEGLLIRPVEPPPPPLLPNWLEDDETSPPPRTPDEARDTTEERNDRRHS